MRKIKKIIAFTLALTFSLVFFGCNPVPAAISAESLTITGRPADDTIIYEENKTLQLSAKILPENADTPSLEWSSESTAVATVAEGGLVTLKGAGKTKISVKSTSPALSDEFTLTVKKEVSSINITDKPASGAVFYSGDIIEVGLEGESGEYVLPYEVDWESSKPSAAIVSPVDEGASLYVMGESGDVTVRAAVIGKDVTDSFTFKAAGERPRVNDFDGNDYFTVTPKDGTVTCTESNTAIPAGGAGNALRVTTGSENKAYPGIVLTAPGNFGNGISYKIEFDIKFISTTTASPLYVRFAQSGSSNDINVAGSTADAKIPVTAAGSSGHNLHVSKELTSGGTKAISIFYGSASAKVDFVIDNISVTGGSVTGAAITSRPASNKLDLKQKTYQLNANLTSGTKTVGTTPAEWESADESVATIGKSTGLLTLKGAGETLITMKAAGTHYSDSFTLSVTNTTNWYPLEMQITGYGVTNNLDVTQQVTVDLSADLIFGDYDPSKIIWSLNVGAEIASISAAGVLTLKGASDNIVVSLKYNTGEKTVTLDTVKFTTTKVYKNEGYRIDRSKYFYGLGEMISGTSDPEKTPEMVYGLTEAMGFTTFRLWMHTNSSLFSVGGGNTVSLKSDGVATYRAQIESLQAAGVERIIAMNHFYVYPSGYNNLSDPMGFFPDPVSESGYYVSFMNMIEQAYYLMATEFPEITYWECGNEMNDDSYCHKSGYINDKTNRKFTLDEKARVVTDLMYYANRGIKRANANNILVMPGLVFNAEMPSFIEKIYQNIASNSYPSVITASASKSTDNEQYFQVLNWHPYNFGGDSGSPGSVFQTRNKAAYDVAIAYGDEGKKVFFTEFGYTTVQGNASAAARLSLENTQGNYIAADYQNIYDTMPYVETVIMFRLFDHENAGGTSIEVGFGLFTSPRAPAGLNGKCRPKKIALELFKKMHGASADTSGLYKYFTV